MDVNDVLKIEEARDGDNKLIGWRIGVGNSGVLIWADQSDRRGMPGICPGEKFFYGINQSIKYERLQCAPIVPRFSAASTPPPDDPRRTVMRLGKVINRTITHDAMLGANDLLTVDIGVHGRNYRCELPNYADMFTAGDDLEILMRKKEG